MIDHYDSTYIKYQLSQAVFLSKFSCILDENDADHYVIVKHIENERDRLNSLPERSSFRLENISQFSYGVKSSKMRMISLNYYTTY